MDDALVYQDYCMKLLIKEGIQFVFASANLSRLKNRINIMT